MSSTKAVAITGGIACGKSLVATYIAKQGHVTYSADRIVGALYDQKHITDTIAEALGTSEKDALRRLIFKNPKHKKTLEDMLHPFVISEIQQKILHHQRAQTPMVFFEIPLLFEAGLAEIFDAIICVSCDLETQLGRLVTRDEVSRKEALSMIQAQWPLELKEARSNFVLKNQDTPFELEQMVNDVLKTLGLPKH